MKLLLTGCFAYTADERARLAALGHEVSFMQQEADALPLEGEEVEGVVCNGLFLHHSLAEFPRLRYVQLTSAGLDRVPAEAFAQRAVTLHTARGVYSQPMAEWALFRVLEHYKRADHFRAAQRDRRWDKHRGLREVSGSRVAIVGAGHVGQTVAAAFEGLGAETTGFDIHTRPTPHFAHMALTATLEERIGAYDVVVLTAPLLPSTRGLVSARVLGAMKQEAMLVNIARGPLVDEQALAQVLATRTDLFAALDVFEEEPLAESSPLWALPNVALSPHNAFVGDGNHRRMFRLIHDNLKAFAAEADHR